MGARDYLYHYKVIHYKVYDGDTIKLILDLGFGIPLGITDYPKTWHSVRINGVDTPEKRGHQSLAGKAVTSVVKSKLILQDCQLIVKSIALDKYAGRFVGDIVLDNGELLSAFLLENKLAKPYDGGTKSKWTDDELADVVRRCDAWHAGSAE